MEEIEKMTSEDEVEAEAKHKVTALDRLQMVSKFFRGSNLRSIDKITSTPSFIPNLML